MKNSGSLHLMWGGIAVGSFLVGAFLVNGAGEAESQNDDQTASAPSRSHELPTGLASGLSAEAQQKLLAKAKQ